jgi:uncharacterized protein YjbJ (UPF0337 family)
MTMKNKAKNAAQVSKGKIEKAAGKAVGSEHLKAQGQIDELKGHLKQAGEKIKDAFKK